jgi:S1-C subfamily serine protease
VTGADHSTAQSTVAATEQRDTEATFQTNASLIQAVKPAVVYVRTETSSGSGFLFDSSGHILTNYHVVQGSEEPIVRLSSGETYQAVVRGYNERVDLAVLDLEAADLPTLAFARHDRIRQGASVFAFGYPFGLSESVAFKEGTISRILSGDEKQYLEVSTEFQQGSSGGPIVNRAGHVVGVSSLLYGGISKDIQRINEPLKIAIPTQVVQEHIADMRSGEKVSVPSRSIAGDEMSRPDQDTTDAAERLKNVFSVLASVDEKIGDAYDIRNEAVSLYNAAVRDCSAYTICTGDERFIDAAQKTEDAWVHIRTEEDRLEQLDTSGLPAASSLRELRSAIIQQLTYLHTIFEREEAIYEQLGMAQVNSKEEDTREIQYAERDLEEVAQVRQERREHYREVIEPLIQKLTQRIE